VRLSNSQAVSLIQHVLCTNDFGAATHNDNERLFQFRLFNRLLFRRVLPDFGFHVGKSLLIIVRSSTKRNNL